MIHSPIEADADPANANANDLLARLGETLGPRGVITAAEDMKAYESSARHGAGAARAVLRPATREELRWTVETLLAARERFVVQGAATGLVSGATPSADGTQWVISTLRLREVLEIDAINRSARVSAGYRLSDINRAAEAHGLCFPIDLGADPTLGGMVAANTGGARLIRYGGVRENLLAVEAVLAQRPARIVGGHRALHKNNTGLSWTHLLCGSSGAFGIVSEATVKLHPIPRQAATAMVATASSTAAMALLCSLETAFGESLSAFEGMSQNALGAVLAHGAPSPFATLPVYAVLIELSTASPATHGVDLEAQLMTWLEAQSEAGFIEDAVIGKAEQLWRLRHGVSEAVQSLGRMVAFDVAVPRSQFGAFRDRAVGVVDAAIPGAAVYDFGHLGDGGVHLNVIVPDGTSADQVLALRDAVYALTVREFDGSYSAEHGIGPYNRRWYAQYTEDAVRDWAAVLHAHFDPLGRVGNMRLD